MIKPTCEQQKALCSKPLEGRRVLANRRVHRPQDLGELEELHHDQHDRTGRAEDEQRLHPHQGLKHASEGGQQQELLDPDRRFGVLASDLGQRDYAEPQGDEVEDTARKVHAGILPRREGLGPVRAAVLPPPLHVVSHPAAYAAILAGQRSVIVEVVDVQVDGLSA